MSFTSEDIERSLCTDLIGKSVVVYDRVESTNEILKKISHDKQYNGLAIFAKHQSKGKGRNGRVWISQEDSSILCSVLVFFSEPVQSVFGAVMLASAIATAKAIIKTFSIEVRIKWPNDIYHKNRKLAGILTESSSLNNQNDEEAKSSFIIGVGINCRQQANEFPEEISDKACSISQILQRNISEQDMISLARELLKSLDFHIKLISQRNYRVLRDEWLNLAGNSGNEISVIQKKHKFAARIVDIDVSDGSLLVQDYSGMIIHLKQNAARIL